MKSKRQKYKVVFRDLFEEKTEQFKVYEVTPKEAIAAAFILSKYIDHSVYTANIYGTNKADRNMPVNAIVILKKPFKSIKYYYHIALTERIKL